MVEGKPGTGNEIPRRRGFRSQSPLCTLGIDVAPGVWHTLAVLSPHAVCYEVKPGPYSASNDKDFARWAPQEGEAGVEEYLEKLLRAAVRAS